jgi:hypothetical protein
MSMAKHDKRMLNRVTKGVEVVTSVYLERMMFRVVEFSVGRSSVAKCEQKSALSRETIMRGRK